MSKNQKGEQTKNGNGRERKGGSKTTEKKEKPWLQEEGKGEELAAEAIAKDHQL